MCVYLMKTGTRSLLIPLLLAPSVTISNICKNSNKLTDENESNIGLFGSKNIIDVHVHSKGICTQWTIRLKWNRSFEMTI